ncbi:MAG: nitroreductase [Chloroflexi bacterium]|nr:nitroreductase [Chloroflexota bacterium]
MDMIEAIKARKSIRGFKPEPVARETISQILAVAVRSPSSLNTQPWEFHVVTGEALNKIRQADLEAFEAGVPPAEGVPGQRPLTGIYRRRQVEQAAQIYELLGIPWEDRARRREWDKGTFRFHNAPTAIVIAADKSLGESATMFNSGLITQTIALAALDFGLGTCIHDIMYADIFRRFTGVPESKRIVICLAIGYPDWTHPANKLESKREPFQNITTWYGF